MPFYLPKFEDADFATAVAHGANLIQPKYDGWFSETTIGPSCILQKSKTDRLLHTWTANDKGEGLSVIQGELIHGTNWAQNPDFAGKTVCYDLLMHKGKNITGLPYYARIDLLKTLLFEYKDVLTSFRVVRNFKLEDYDAIQKPYIEDLDFEGWVFRGVEWAASHTLYRYKTTLEVEGTIIGFNAGEGKYANTLGSLCVRLDNGAVTDVSGFDDKLRDLMWLCQERFLNKKVEIKAKRIFKETGKPRHPQFLRFVSGQDIDITN